MQTLTCISKTKLFTWIKKKKKNCNQKEIDCDSEQPEETLQMCVNAYRVKGQKQDFKKMS